MKIVEREFGPAIMTLETGRMAKQANGSVLVTYGDTVVLVAATAATGGGDGKGSRKLGGGGGLDGLRD